MRDVERRARSSKRAARALVVERYDWSAVAGELEDALVRVAGSATAPPSAAPVARRHCLSTRRSQSS